MPQDPVPEPGEAYAVTDIKATEYVAFSKLASLFDLYSGLTAETAPALLRELEAFRAR